MPKKTKSRSKKRSSKYHDSLVRLTIIEHDLYGHIFDMATKRPKDSFDQIIKRVVPAAMLKAKDVMPFIAELRKAYQLAR